MSKWVKEMRIIQWSKNVLIFIPIVFALKFDINSIVLSIIGFMIFSFTASSIYIINDIVDVESDRKHPRKKNRPIASGQISLLHGWMVVIALILLSVLLSIVFVKSTYAYIILVIYVLNSLLYSYWIKRIPILDVFSLSVGYVLRFIFGAVIVSVVISKWLIIVAFIASLYGGVTKRYLEMNNYKNTRYVLQFYSRELLQSYVVMLSSALIVTYAMYVFDSNLGNKMLLTLPVFVYILFRYQYILYNHHDDDPIMLVLKDANLLIFILLYALIVVGVIISNHFIALHKL